MVIQLMNCEKTLLEELKHKEVTQKDVATTYAFCLTSDEKIDYPKINRAIMKRWSFSGLKRVKEMAHKMVDKRKQ